MRSLSPPQLACVVALGALVLSYLDAPFRTFRQRFLTHRWAERLVLLSVEMNLILVWLMQRVLLRRDWPIAPRLAEPIVAWAGAVIVVLGVGLSIWAKLRLGRWFSASFGVKPGHVLVTDGPYGVTRHPIYTGLLAAVAGCALAWNSALTLALAALLVIPLVLHTAVEEALFVEHFGEPYREYRRRVPRLMPGWRGTRA